MTPILAELIWEIVNQTNIIQQLKEENEKLKKQLASTLHDPND